MAPEPTHQSPQASPSTFSSHIPAAASWIRQASGDASRGARGNEAMPQYFHGPNGVPSRSRSPPPPPSQSSNTIQIRETTDGSNGNKYSTTAQVTTRQPQAPIAPTRAGGLTAMAAPHSSGIPELYPPELFATIHDQGIYRCTSIDYSSLEFLKT